MMDLTPATSNARLASSLTAESLLRAESVSSLSPSSPSHVEATVNKWRDVEQGLLGGEQRRWRQTPGGGEALHLLVDLPAELQSQVLSHLDLRSMLALRSTCWWTYSLINSNRACLLCEMLRHVVVEWNFRAEQASGLRPIERASIAPVLDAIRKINSPSNAVYQTLALTVFTMATMRGEHALTVEEQDSFQHIFDPRYSEMAVVDEIHRFTIPKSFHFLKDDTMTAVSEGLARMAIPNPGHYGRRPRGKIVASLLRPLGFGAEVLPVTSVKHMGNILRENATITDVEEEPVTFQTPSGEDAVKVFSWMVNSQEIMVWYDPQFKARIGHGGFKFIVVGGHLGAVVQWHYEQSAFSKRRCVD